jgi:hypothetical protein
VLSIRRPRKYALQCAISTDSGLTWQHEDAAFVREGLTWQHEDKVFVREGLREGLGLRPIQRRSVNPQCVIIRRYSLGLQLRAFIRLILNIGV